MKKIVVHILCAAMLLLVACTPQAEKTAETDGVFKAGYGRANVTPKVSVGLTGFGNANTRKSDNLLSYLYLTCLAVTDGNDNTVLLYGVDGCTSDSDVTNALRYAVESATGIPGQNIMISATHSHSVPEITDPIFQSMLLEGAVESAEEALANLAPAKVQIGSVMTEKLNFVRHYVQENGAYVGNNFGNYDSSPIVDHVTKADGQMQLVRFERDGKDIVVMNFQAHPTMTGSASKYDISADFVGACREKMEAELDCNFLYFTGAAGNLNTTSKIAEENIPGINYKLHGQTLAQYAIDAIDSLTEVNSGQVKVLNQTFVGECDHSDGDLIKHIDVVYTAYNSGGAAAAQKAGAPYGINSIYHARAISRRAGTANGDSLKFEISTVSIGDVAFAFCPYEMFDTNGMTIKQDSPFKMTVICTLANDGFSYIAPEYAFDHGCYEVDMRYFVRGTAEKLVDSYLEMLHSMHEG